jgi:hypothetical protein
MKKKTGRAAGRVFESRPFRLFFQRLTPPVRGVFVLMTRPSPFGLCFLVK